MPITQHLSILVLRLTIYVIDIDGIDLLRPVCDAMSSSPGSAAVASASSIITAAIGPATATTTSNPAAMMGIPSEGILAALLAALLV